MLELVLNGVWIAVAAGAFAAAPRRSPRTFLTLACILALLFPIISVSDDFADRSSLEEAFALLVAAFALLVGLVAVSRLDARNERPSLVFVTAPSDPRSPPRR